MRLTITREETDPQQFFVRADEGPFASIADARDWAELRFPGEPIALSNNTDGGPL